MDHQRWLDQVQEECQAMLMRCFFDMKNHKGAVTAYEALEEGSPGREMAEEDIVRHQARDGHDAPAGRPLQELRQAAEMGNAVGRHAQTAQAFEIGVASAPDQDP